MRRVYSCRTGSSHAKSLVSAVKNFVRFVTDIEIKTSRGSCHNVQLKDTDELSVLRV
jgi:hypothetical protein